MYINLIQIDTFPLKICSFKIFRSGSSLDALKLESYPVVESIIVLKKTPNVFCTCCDVVNVFASLVYPIKFILCTIEHTISIHKSHFSWFSISFHVEVNSNWTLWMMRQHHWNLNGWHHLSLRQHIAQLHSKTDCSSVWNKNIWQTMKSRTMFIFWNSVSWPIPIIQFFVQLSR